MERGSEDSLVEDCVFTLRLEEASQPGLHHDVDLPGGVVWDTG